MQEGNLSIKQQVTCCFIRSFTEAHGFPPNLREIGRWCGYSGMRSLELALSALEQRGYLTRNKHSGRSIVLTEQGIAVARRWQFVVLEAA